MQTERLDARAALELGLASRVVPAETFRAGARAMAHEMASLPPAVVQGCKDLLNAHLPDLDRHFGAEAAAVDRAVARLDAGGLKHAHDS
jgi:enoyl-CoA hydratase/carnithine racemase